MESEWGVAIEHGGQTWYATGEFAHAAMVLPIRIDDLTKAKRFGSESEALEWAIEERLLPAGGKAIEAMHQWRLVRL